LEGQKGRETAVTAAVPNTKAGEMKQAGSSRIAAVPPTRRAVISRVSVFIGESVVVERIVARGGNPSDSPISVFADDDAILANLSVPVFFREGEAEIPGTILINGDVLPGSGGADHVESLHLLCLN